MIRHAAVIGLILLGVGAGRALADSPATSATSAAAPIDPVFDCYSANSAWGLSYAGKTIARDGRVWRYRERGKALPERSGEPGHGSYDAAALRAKFAAATAAEQIDAATLAEKVALIERAAAGNITSSDTGVRDAGTSSCHAYLAAEQGKRYRDIELGSDAGVGDRRIVNDAPEAQGLLDWLRSVGVAK